MGELYLAIDQGGHASRAMVFDQQGSLQAQASQALHALHPHPHFVEYSPQALVLATQIAIRQVLQQLGESASQVVSAGLATQRSNIACWDRYTGLPLCNIISWQDLRNASWMEGFAEQRELIHQRSGLFANGHYGVSKLRWCMENIPAVASAQAEGRLAWGPMASYLAYTLLREHPVKVDPANASRTLLLNIHELQWDAVLANCFDLPLDNLPQVVPSTHHYGFLDVAGFDIPLQLLNGDQSSALFSHGWPDPDRLYINLGTGAFVQRVIEEPISTAQPLLSSVVWQGEEQRYLVLEGTVNGAACAVQQIAAELDMEIGEMEVQIEQWLGWQGELPLFMNSVSGIGSPYWRNDLGSHFIGEGEPWQKIVAVYESVLFFLQQNIREMARHTPAATSIQISGGLANCDALCQRLANLSGLRVIRPEQCEATAQGVAFLLNSHKSRWQVQLERSFEPSQDPVLQQRYQRWSMALTDWINSH